MAAQAIEHGYGLMTLKVDAFVGLPGLRLVSPGVQAGFVSNETRQNFPHGTRRIESRMTGACVVIDPPKGATR